MQPSRFLGLEFKLMLQLGQIPSRYFIIHGISDLTIELAALEIQVASDVFVLLDVFADFIRHGFPKHSDQVINGKANTESILQLHPLRQGGLKADDFVTFRTCDNVLSLKILNLSRASRVCW